MPKVDWNEENRRYSLCFFPLVGIVVGAVLFGWINLCKWLDINVFLSSAGAVLIPVLVTGGIHLDGFCDVSDALASRTEGEKLFEIMKDSRVGAFAVINLVSYFILQFALFSEISDMRSVLVISLGYALSRGLSGLAAATFRSANKNGTLYAFSSSAPKITTIIVLSVLILLFAEAMIVVSPVYGTFAALGAFVSFVFYRLFSYKKFGGITGDLAGWFLQICEISQLLFAVFGSKIAEVI